MLDNTKEIFYAIYCLINLVTLEATDQDTLVDLIHFCLNIQLATSQSISPVSFCMHALIAAYFNLVSKLYKIAEFSKHVDQVNFPKDDHRLKTICSSRFFILVKNMHRIFFHRMPFVIYLNRIQLESPFPTNVSSPKRLSSVRCRLRITTLHDSIESFIIMMEKKKKKVSCVLFYLFSLCSIVHCHNTRFSSEKHR